MELLERSQALGTLAAAFAAAGSGDGRLALVSGEAGAGKTALLSRFVADAAARRVLWGSCERLFTPRALGPFLDVVPELADASPHAVVAAVTAELRGGPAIVVLEDLHWADEATLDAFRLLARRLGGLPALVVASYREDEPAPGLRLVLGDLAGRPGVVRVGVPPLTRAAVGALCAPAGADADAVHAGTAGNPFFVTEVLAAAADGVPVTVRDAVLARAAGLSEPGRALLEAVAVVPSRMELWLLEAIPCGDLGALDECLARGMLRATDSHVSFRHELARQAVEEATPPGRRIALHRAVLAALGARPGVDPARLAHHAAAAGDEAAIRRHAPAAAARAAALGAHAAAAAHYAAALRVAAELPAGDQAALHARYAQECALCHREETAVAEFAEARRRYRGLGDRRGEGDALARRAVLLWFFGRTAEAEAAAHAAVDLLAAGGEGPELARAYGVLARQALLAQRDADVQAWGERALALAERCGDVALQAEALNTLGTGRFRAGDPGGRELLERSLALAREAGQDEHVVRALVNLGGVQLVERRYAAAARTIDEGLAYAAGRELGAYTALLLTTRADCDLRRGAWARAEETARSLAGRESALPVVRVEALAVLGVLHARRGAAAESRAALDAAHALAVPEELQQCALVAAARAEALWLDDDADGVLAATDYAFALARARDDRRILAELACWRARAGAPAAVAAPPGDPYGLELAGDPSGAARRWRELGCPYEAAVAQLAGADEAALQAALLEFRRLGAARTANKAARRLRGLGAQPLRGPRPSTLANPAQLTGRQLEILELLCEGLGNAEIAARLYISAKTVDHHVSAVLRKLGVRSRQEAGRAARELGMASPR
jgi:DNA-binding CsgD family transcriptional regulator